jgi:uncharacterized protein YcgI (DUF1989 family)
MEYLSIPHTRIAIQKLTPKVNDTLISNLHSPLVTIIEDTTAGKHDTTLPACDGYYYRTLGVEKWEEHGSCAENLVLALKQLNENAGLTGKRAVGSDITVNIAPTPLHLFMNTTITSDGSVKIEEPKGPKRSHVKFKAERDVVVVMSACPNEKGVMNGGKVMAANFVVEEPPNEQEEQETTSASASKPKTASKAAAPKTAQASENKDNEAKGAESSKDTPKVEKKKPKKLERRS